MYGKQKNTGIKLIINSAACALALTGCTKTNYAVRSPHVGDFSSRTTLERRSWHESDRHNTKRKLLIGHIDDLIPFFNEFQDQHQRQIGFLRFKNQVKSRIIPYSIMATTGLIFFGTILYNLVPSSIDSNPYTLQDPMVVNAQPWVQNFTDILHELIENCNFSVDNSAAEFNDQYKKDLMQATDSMLSTSKEDPIHLFHDLKKNALCIAIDDSATPKPDPLIEMVLDAAQTRINTLMSTHRMDLEHLNNSMHEGLTYMRNNITQYIYNNLQKAYATFHNVTQNAQHNPHKQSTWFNYGWRNVIRTCGVPGLGCFVYLRNRETTQLFRTEEGLKKENEEILTQFQTIKEKYVNINSNRELDFNALEMLRKVSDLTTTPIIEMLACPLTSRTTKNKISTKKAQINEVARQAKSLWNSIPDENDQNVALDIYNSWKVLENYL